MTKVDEKIEWHTRVISCELFPSGLRSSCDAL